MKLICEHCGEEVESGILNVMNHVYDSCKATTITKINETYSIRSAPFAKLKQADETKTSRNGDIN